MATKKTYYATRDFSDAGTERRFASGEEIKKCTDGQIENYAAAGLVSTDSPKSETPEQPATDA